MNILLIGFMGSGKSTIGKKMSRKINYNFIDVDRELEKSQGLSITEIFSQKGELFFRECETNWLKNFKGTDTVISLGGGTPCFNNNISIINKLGKSVYLKMNIGLLTNRLVQSKTKRPLIEKYKSNISLLEQKINELLNEREVFYNKAEFIIDGSNFNNEKYNELIEKLKL